MLTCKKVAGKKRYITEKRPNATLSQKLCECNKQQQKLVCVFLLVLYDFVKFRPHATTMMFYRLEYIYAINMYLRSTRYFGLQKSNKFRTRFEHKLQAGQSPINQPTRPTGERQLDGH